MSCVFSCAAANLVGTGKSFPTNRLERRLQMDSVQIKSIVGGGLVKFNGTDYGTSNYTKSSSQECAFRPVVGKSERRSSCTWW